MKYTQYGHGLLILSALYLRERAFQKAQIMTVHSITFAIKAVIPFILSPSVNAQESLVEGNFSEIIILKTAVFTPNLLGNYFKIRFTLCQSQGEPNFGRFNGSF